MYYTSKRTHWKKSVTGHLTRQSTSSSTNMTNDEPTIATVSKIDLNTESDPDTNPHNRIYFNDGIRRVDFVLVFEECINAGQAGANLERHLRRQFFEDNLMKAGLELEEDAIRRHESPSSGSRTTVFIKVHAPWSVLCRQAESLKMRMPLQLQDAFAGHLEPEDISISKLPHWIFKLFRFIWSQCQRLMPFRIRAIDQQPTSTARPSIFGIPSVWGIPFGHRKKPKPKERWVTWPFQRKRINKFLFTDVDTFFSPTQRMEMVWDILQRSRNDTNDEKKRGIELLLDLKIYEAIYPLHDGSDVVPAGGQPMCERQQLKLTWARWGCLFKDQPIEVIRSYFGERVAFYFSFLGFYTKMLTFPAVFGVIAFAYGVAYAEDDEVVRSVCDHESDPGNRMMCPVCKLPNCDFTPLSHGCWNALWEYRVDNEATLVLACFTVVWATVFLKMWKRKEAELAFQWDTYDVEVEDLVVRPEYEERATQRRPNPITREIEPYVPKSTRAWCLVVSTLVTALMLAGVGAALVGLILARIQLYGALNRAGIEEHVNLSRWIVHILTFVVVAIFELAYNTVAEKTTSWECPRTQSQWLSSYLWKVFVFQLLNDFVPIAYASWIKGKTANPQNLSWSSELCETGGCMSEATELIAVLLLARLVIGNSTEIGIPFVKRLWTKFQDKKEQANHTGDNDSQWHQDMLLDTLTQDGVAREYMEMIIQFAFCTLFVPAFPAAPIICLLNNILEIRVDAINFVASHRRPLPMRVSGIGIWNSFLDIIAKLAILCNAGLISFTSEIVPRFYYKYILSKHRSLNGYPEHALTYLPKEAWTDPMDRSYLEHHNISGCWYEDRPRLNDTLTSYAPIQTSLFNDGDPDEQLWWQVMTMRIVVFALFAISAFTFQWLYNFIIPDTPADVTLKIQRRRYVVMKAMETEMVYDKWLKQAMNSAAAAESGRRRRTEYHDSSFHSPQVSTQFNGHTVDEEEEEDLESISKEEMRNTFPYKRR